MTRLWDEAGNLTLVDVRGVGLLSGLGALLLVARSGSLLSGILLLSGRLAGGRLGRGLLLGGTLGRHGYRVVGWW